MHKRGISEEQIRVMLVDTPRGILDHGSGY
jgi:predicted metal-dependent phosphotriesterase family hydrolase